MRVAAVFVILALAVGATSCAVSGQVPAPAVPWGVGFWYWHGSEVTSEWKDLPVDAIFFHAGSIVQDEIPPHQWHAGRELPSQLPSARTYWMVLRYDRQGVPALAAIPKLAESVKAIQTEAARRQIRLTGLQLDIDAPTRALREYAAFRKEK